MKRRRRTADHDSYDPIESEENELWMDDDEDVHMSRVKQGGKSSSSLSLDNP